ncbi:MULTISPECIES: peptidogalycan biosysnthesis protein [unclassified Prochlorococcus]|uniref:peptidogalycan biosysnthesis protein n=1 Tax=unclassified Prochlorococcus TaxID=2627481 RepID=UPI00097CC5E6|nr:MULTISPECIES: GNAT family N-acetyltransferase [unclassified Prochlorococcus]AQL30312.1 GNAT family N-acetyltransferase [Prochlorococcus sp. RS50]AQL32742.1 GNAT family N-acetyltransferase [Prochlorococcus sp. RS01]AQL34004.1 GNAT family N-acetyltransferase [Prochlorococcus sp. RS04]
MNQKIHKVEVKFSIKEISKEIWNELTNEINNPFYEWTWLKNLEISKSVSRETGWQPLYFVAYKNEEILGIAPLFLKNHSYGEFIFDQSFARLAQELNLNYYPKLIGMSPYSPVNGYQFLYKKNEDKKEITNLLINHIESFAITNKILSCNFLYIDESWGNYLKSLGYHKWINSSSEWRSNGEKTFDDFLCRFNSNQRKNIKKERKSITKQDIKVEIFNEDDINQEILKKMHNFYEQHCSRWGVWGSKYLTSTFFEKIVANKKNILLFSASKNDSNDIFAMSMCVKNKKNLWGRYWGTQEDISNLHFELCYYQPIEWAIKNNIHFFDPGAGGKHKRRRGFFAKSTISLHKWFDKNMENIIYPWLNEVNKQTEKGIEFENNSIPFK